MRCITRSVRLALAQIGALMSGTVSKVGADYLSLLCGGVFNVAIGRQDIRKEFQPKSDTAWATKSGAGSSPAAGTFAAFAWGFVGGGSRSVSPPSQASAWSRGRC